MRKLILNIHLWAGLIAALFLLILGVSGTLLVFENEINDALNSKILAVQPAGERLSLSTITDKVVQKYPGSKVVGFGFPSRPDRSLAVYLVGARDSDVAISVNPYTAEVVGDFSQKNGWMIKVHGLHTHLLAGKLGQQIVGWSGIFLLALAISGLVLWWPRKRFRLQWNSPGHIFNFDLHNFVGIVSSLFLLIFSLTGIAIHFERPVDKWATQISHVQPAKRLALDVRLPGTLPLSADKLLEITQNILPGARPTFMDLSANGKDPVRVTLKFPEDHTPAGRSRILLDPYSGKVLQLQNARALPAAMKYAQMWNREIHTGDIYGWPTRIIAAWFSLMLPVLAISGPLMWWQRRKRE